MAPAQVRPGGAPEDVNRLTEFLASLDQISASPVSLKPGGGGLAQGYLTVIITGETR